MAIRSVAVFCGSREGNNPLFVQHAKELGRILVQRNLTVVYGGANRGIMGALANSVLENNGKIIGVMPKVLMHSEIQHMGLTEMHEVADMHVRKALLYEKCDAAIILAGGYGTMDELFEMLTWNQLNIHDKKIVVLNTDGFYDHLLLQLKKMEEENFFFDEPLKRIAVISSPAELLLP